MAKNKTKKGSVIASQRLMQESKAEDDIFRLQALLARYGYLFGAYIPGKYDEATRLAVMQFQNFYRIYPDQDGIADEATITLINQKRCGLPDPTPGQRGASGRLAPFVTVGAKWNKNPLTYQFLNSTPDLPEARQREIIREAFTRWSAVCSLKFTEITGNASSDLSVAFHRASHGDGNAFDDAGGPDGNTLAHAFFPPPAGGSWSGSLHFDEFESWKDQPGGTGTRLYNVTLHEIGHLLGLSHSQDQNAIMYAYYAEDRNDLRPDDIAGIQSLYGAPVEQPTAIQPGETISGHLAQTNAELRYQVTLQNKLLVKLDGPSGQDFDVYIRHGAPAGKEPGQYDQVSWGATADELLTVDNPKPGTYHILVQSYRGSGSFNLEVELA